jgi:hypothetical protein
VSAKKQKDNEDRLARALTTLQQVADSNVTPRNIRRIVKDAMVALQDQGTGAAVRAANALSLLDEIAQDPNMPSFSRVTIWQAVSALEAVRE